MHMDIGYDADTRQFTISLPNKTGPNTTYTGNLRQFRRTLEDGFPALRDISDDHAGAIQSLWAALLKMEGMERDAQRRDH